MPADAKKNRLRLRAEDDEDLTVISACLQDAVVVVGDIAYLPAERLLAMVINRFRWEGGSDANPGNERVLAGLCLESVRGVRAQGIDRARKDGILSVLAVRRVPGAAGAAVIEIVFSGGKALRVTADKVTARLEDLDQPYPTPWRPAHKLDDSA